jgi:hypothetical protein
MKLRYGIMLGVGILALSVVAWWMTSPVIAQEGGAAAVTMAVVEAGGLTTMTEDYEYVGSQKCKKCHIKIFKSWEKTKKGSTVFNTLKPGVASEMKSKHGLDPAKDYTKDATCLACHTTGFGHASGYAVPAEDDPVAAKKAEQFAHVGCESCHGPASGYLPLFEEIQKSKRKYKVEELHAKGLKTVDATTCTNCHNEKNPTFDAATPFDFEKLKEKGTHEHEELKLREG